MNDTQSEVSAVVMLESIFPMTQYLDMRDQGYVRRQTHPDVPLAILNYSEKAQYEQRWNTVTLNCRGLIYNYETGEVVARGFRKFFNWDDSSRPYPPSGPVLRMPKMDGSLGILYRASSPNLSDAAQWRVATRGSFASDQAQWASGFLWRQHNAGELDLNDLRSDRSYLVEIIYPENRIVVDYKGAKRLVLLDVLDTATGRTDLDEFDRVYWIDKVEHTYIPSGFSDSFGHDIPAGEEGFVVYWPERDYRVKMKAAEYLELHKMIFSLSERSVWERLGNGETVAEICERLPDEFHGWVKDVADKLQREYLKIDTEARRAYLQILGESADDSLIPDRKTFASKATAHPLRAYLFMLFDGKAIRDAIWKTLRPVGGKGVTTISEDVA